MAYEPRPNSGTIFKNDEKKKDTDPNARGSALIDGVEYWVSAWTNISKQTGEPYQSLKFNKKDDNRAPNPGIAPSTDPDPFDDDIPF